MIVAADSEEDWAVVKRGSNKVWIVSLSERSAHDLVRGRLAITGAGGSDYLSYLKRRIADRIQHGAVQKTFFDDVTEIIKTEMIDFYGTHYTPLAHLEAHRYQEPSLIIGGVFGGVRGLWRTHGSTVVAMRMGYEAVGAGTVWARAVLDSNIAFLASEHAATLTACYAIYSAKERDGYCGKDTHLAALRPGEVLLEWADPDAIRAAENVFRKYDELQSEMLNAIVLPPKNALEIHADSKLATIRAELDAINFYPIFTQQS